MHQTNSGTPKFIKMILLELKTQIDIDLLIVGDFNTPLYPMEKSSG